MEMIQKEWNDELWPKEMESRNMKVEQERWKEEMGQRMSNLNDQTSRMHLSMNDSAPRSQVEEKIQHVAQGVVQAHQLSGMAHDRMEQDNGENVNMRNSYISLSKHVNQQNTSWQGPDVHPMKEVN